MAIQLAIATGADAGIALKVCSVETKKDCKDLQWKEIIYFCTIPADSFLGNFGEYISKPVFTSFFIDNYSFFFGFLDVFSFILRFFKDKLK